MAKLGMEGARRFTISVISLRRLEKALSTIMAATDGSVAESESRAKPISKKEKERKEFETLTKKGCHRPHRMTPKRDGVGVALGSKVLHHGANVGLLVHAQRNIITCGIKTT